MARVALSTFGSVGDLHPFVAIGKGLQARGHDAVIAAPPVHGPRVERYGLAFRPVRPDTRVSSRSLPKRRSSSVCDAIEAELSRRT